MKLVSDGFLLGEAEAGRPTSQKDHVYHPVDRSTRAASWSDVSLNRSRDLYIQLIDYSGLVAFREPTPDQVPTVVAEAPPTAPATISSRSSISWRSPASEKRIPDGILYINGLPLVVFEFKSAIREEATIHDAYVQLTTRYQRDIPELFKYNAFCVISDGVNNKAGSFFAPYEFFYAWRKTDGGDLIEKDGINSLYSMIQGLFQQTRLLDVIRNFIYLPDTSRKEEKILCRYPQYYAATKLYRNILSAPEAGRRRQGRHLFWGDGLRQELHHAVPGAAC
jgi:type I restriction enzyme R subunit